MAANHPENHSEFRTETALESLGVRTFELPIHDQPQSWLIENFSERATDYPVNVTVLIRNIIWQLRQRVRSGEREPLKELIRTFWYMYIKPTLSRAGALSQETDQYNQLVDILAEMVKEHRLLEYKDIGFRDDNQANRHVGGNANIIVFSEKVGHAGFLAELRAKYDTSTIALGGQPSLMNVEYFVDDFKKQGVNLNRSFFLFSIVDYDPSGSIIRDAFINDLKRYGIHHLSIVNLVNPDMLTPDEVKASRFLVPDSEAMSKKNTAWLKEISQANYANQQYLGPFKDHQNKRQIYGLEAEAVSSARLQTKLDELLQPLVGKDEDFLKRRGLEYLSQALKDLLLRKITT